MRLSPSTSHVLILSLFQYRLLPRTASAFSFSSSSLLHGGGCGNKLPRSLLRPGHCSYTIKNYIIKMTSSTINREVEEEDPYIYLEDIESGESLDFAKSANAKCLSSLGDPKLSIDGGTYTRILAALDSDERIPYVSVLGYDDTTTTANDENGEMLLYNFWKDSKVSYILKCVCDDVIMHGGCNIMTPLNFFIPYPFILFLYSNRIQRVYGVRLHYHPTSRPIQYGVLSSTLISWPRRKTFLGYGRGIQPSHVH